jgi:3-mercaptopyruvate sulfurtransferase SseA
MRRTVAVVLIALGVFCLALAPMMRTWMSSSLMKTPLDYYNPTVNVGEVTYFNIEDVELVEDADVEAHSTIRADVASSSDDVVVWDVRSDGEYDGTNSRGNQRAGHIPGAIHLEWFNVMDRQTHRFKPAEEIRRMLQEKGITPGKRVHTY